MRKSLDGYWIFVSIITLGLGLVWIWLSKVTPDSIVNSAIQVPQEGFLAPDFELVSLEGELVSLSELRGKAVLVNFWATWCPPCRSEMPAMQQVFDEYGTEKFVILAVNRTHQDRSQDVETFVLERELTFPILLDNTGDVSNQYQVRSLPTSYFIDPDGIIREVVIGGPMAEALLRSRVDHLLGEGY